MNKSKQQYTPVRFSHLMSYAGIGAIVRGAEDRLMVITDIRYWTDKTGQISANIIPYVKRVSKALNIDKELRMPPSARLNERDEIEGVYLPAVLFPVYAKCQKCGLLHNNPWRKQDKRLIDDTICEDCGNKLEQVTWCAVSNKGYMSEVPWHYICHLESDIKCEIDYENSYLKVTTDNNGKSVIRCMRCGSQNYYENSKIKIINSIQPWIYEKAPELDENDIVEILEVNNPGVYLPERVNALVIPPESRIIKNSIIDRLYNSSKLRREIDSIKIPLRRKSKLKEIATKYRCSIEEIKEALDEIKKGYPYYNENITVGELIEDEYKAFLTPLEDVRDDEDFVTVHKTKEFHLLYQSIESQELKSIVRMIDNHIIAMRLREIQVFKGFYRGYEDDNTTRELVPPDIVGSSNWLPAIELFGEGVFFTIDENILSKWETLHPVKKRADEILKRYEKSEVTLNVDVEVTPRFLLLHTLSHLLIRELESIAGYPAASLKERIYCSRDRKMSGVLIYTTVSDIVGSLGGIVESAEPKEFLSLMDSAFKHAMWCSLDPVCTEHEGQGPGWLNRAACHACALIPEPSCAYGNVFLDRIFIKGSESLGIPNFLEFVAKEKMYD
ncbi:MAG: hypothetical protein DSY76_05400 [Bacteroidetes bacterium]|nr:MAG: hypothetical protein DSY76_05400 [Bacteroidota bacterium]